MLPAGAVVVRADEVGQDLRVRLGTENVPRREQVVLQLGVVLDDPVMDHRETPGAVEVRVRVGVGGLAVRGPARVGDADVAGGGVSLDEVGQRLDAALALARLDLAAVDGGQPGRVIAAVFEPAQAVEQDRGGGGFADVADDAAHICAHRRADRQ